MSLTSFRKSWGRLIRKAETKTLKFKHKPKLKLSRRLVPSETVGSVSVPRKLVKKNSRFAEVSALHELREALRRQNGYSRRAAHRIATRNEAGDIRKLGLTRTQYYKRVKTILYG